MIRYANCWEDADILLKGMDPKAGDRILSIGSGGDNSLALLSRNPECVVAVDISEPQLHLIALKKAAVKHLDYEAFLGFLGFKPMQKTRRTTEKGGRWAISKSKTVLAGQAKTD